MIKKNTPLYVSLIKLTKPIITLSVAFSALTGYVLYAGSFSSGWHWMYIGVLIIAAGSSAINQIQEAVPDKLMNRTQNRPIPSGNISLKQAWIWAILLSVTGASILLLSTTIITFILAVLTLLWYNGVYTPLKRVTPWAIIPGALVGALPPAIGWTAAGGSITHPHITLLAFFFFMGQIPHFWLIILRHGADYARGGFPSIHNLLSIVQISRLTFIWTATSAITAMLLPSFGLISSLPAVVTISILSLGLIVCFGIWPGLKEPSNIKWAFLTMNGYFFLVMVIIIFDSLIKN
jgi:heme o synthase